ncbi:Holliday junction resolvase RuvX [Cardinium endosymbiont of Culicoides punctatus]|uniref:Holliday junction resolvase RuvX n=1 Tax=Cardinium endosymbiont of Culicoides punctatus TaxID=2304601 RepID=UPI0010590A82|nr:Holliday junction resolvase RuvX [Cardinium endosymbiont of Culicoides punctatus]TDG95781.1 putative pre-16S rRNA nuclease [Cardinium endosymbiont of Culicoides punctatus]
MAIEKGRILAIDYGLKRVGIAVTDPMQIIATPLITIHSNRLFIFLQEYIQKERVVAFVIGMPMKLNGSSSEMSSVVEDISKEISKKFFNQNLYYQDERFSSKLAAQGLYQAGFSKKDRKDKMNIDKTSATIILQSFLYSKNYSGG